MLRRFALYVGLYLLAPVALLAALEGVLRLAGVGTSTAWLLERQCGGSAWHTPNPAFYQQFTALPLYEIMNWDELEFMVPEVKGPDTVRIFAFGESALFGYRSAARMLEVMLAQQFPGKRFEVYNAACPGISSHLLRVAARTAAKYQPDLFLIYMGNNEAVGPYGPRSMLGRSNLGASTTLIQAVIALNQLRLTQIFTGAGSAPKHPPSQEELLASVPAQTNTESLALLYEDNLTAMLDAARDAGAASVLCTLASNRAFGGQDAKRPASLDALERGGLNQVVLRTAEARKDSGVWLCDTERALYEQSPAGLPDYGFFSDNIHFTFNGAYAAARAMFTSTCAALADRLPAEAGKVIPPTRDDVARLLGWNAAAEIALLRIQVAAGFDDYSKQLLRERLATLEAETKDAPVEAGIAAGCEKALLLRPEDVALHRMRFETLMFGKQPDAALRAAEEMAAKFPCSRLALRSLGQALNETMQGERAREAYTRVLEIYPDDLPSRISLGLGQ